MSGFLKKLDTKLSIIFEEVSDFSWKDPSNPEYDRQTAENALYNTVGPLTNNPRWMPEWDGHSEPVPGFVPGGQAPQWTTEEVMVACAGDPNYMNFSGNPRSPRYGDRGGSPLFRMARRMAKKYGRDDYNLIVDLYSNGLVELARRVQPGYDEGRSPFIRWLFGQGDGSGGKVLPFIQSAMEAGIGSSKRARGAIGALNTLMAAKTPKQAEEIANSISGKYRTQRSYDKLEGNTYDQFSPEIYSAATKTANILASQDRDAIEANKQELSSLKEKLSDEMEMIPGASTGIGQAITNKDRASKMNIVSADANMGGEEGANIGATLAAPEHGEEMAASTEAFEVIYQILDYAMKFDFREILQKGSKYLSSENGPRAVGGKLTINELRYYIRYHGLSNYPGKGTVRGDTSQPRDGKKPWCMAGEDPELEPIPNGGTWHSIWSREGYREIRQTEIAAEMTKEVLEFNELGIQTGRVAKQKPNGKFEAISKVAVDTQLKSATDKILIAAALVKDELGEEELEESTKTTLRGMGIVLVEDMNYVDALIFNKGYNLLRRQAVKLIKESFR